MLLLDVLKLILKISDTDAISLMGSQSCDDLLKLPSRLTQVMSDGIIPVLTILDERGGKLSGLAELIF